MALTHTTAIRDGLTNYVVDALDAGTGANGDMRLTPATTATTLCVIDLLATAFGASSSGTATMNGSPSGTATGAGTATVFIMRNTTDTEVFRGVVGTTGQDLNLSSNVLAVSDKVQITSFTYSSSA